MCRRMPTLWMIGLVIVGVILIHRARRARSIERVARTEQIRQGPDTAATLREMTHSPTPDKSWVTDGDQSDANTRLIVGRTHKPAVSEKEALHDARRDVQSRVLSAFAHAIHPSHLDSTILRDRVAADVSTGRFEIDRVAEKFDRPYGQVWTESVLVDLSPDKMNPVAAEYRRELQKNRDHIRSRWIGLGAITVLVLFGYTLSNAITRGYFTGRLRVMALLVVALGAAALI